MGIELKDLTGEGVLDAVDYSTISFEKWEGEFEDCNAIRFRLNGVAYIAAEDPADGYRSHMRELAICEEPMTNVFQGVRVVGVYRDNGQYGETDDVLELIDVESGKTVLRVGTQNTSDYYPNFVSAFNPENMAINANA